MNQTDARALFERLVSAPEHEIDVVRAALAIAAEEDRTLDVETWAHRIDGLAHRALVSIDPYATEEDRFGRLNDLFFDELGFTGEGTDFESPESSFLHKVVEHRRGLPIALCVLYVRIGRGLGLSCAGVGFPGHFLAKVTTPAGETFVDPFERRRVVTVSDLAQRLARGSGGNQQLERWMLAASSPRQTLARLLRNLKNLYMRKKDPARAFCAVDRILLLEPEAWDELRDRGLLCAALGAAEAARRDLGRYLAHVPEAPDTPVIRSRLAGLADAKTLLN